MDFFGGYLLATENFSKATIWSDKNFMGYSLQNFYVQNVIGHRYSWNKCFLIYWTDAEKNEAACHNTSQVVKLEMHLLQHLLVFQSWYNVTSNKTWKLRPRQNKFVVRQKLLPYLVVQLVARHRLHVYNISTSACDKVRLIQIWRQNHVLHHILNIA